MTDPTRNTNKQDRLDPQLQYLFEAEILHQWDFAQAAMGLMSTASEKRDTKLFWFGMDAALGAFANISKILFPPRNASSPARRRTRLLRDAFEVKEDSLLKERALRDAFEHFDQAIDQWFKDSTDRNFADRNIGPPMGMIAPEDHLRHFDPKTNIVSVLGKALDLQALVTEVEQIVQRVTQQRQQRQRHMDRADRQLIGRLRAP